LSKGNGSATTGLLLLHVVDPDYETEAFAAKQLLHEPFMGGGLAIPRLALGGMAIWTIVLFFMNRRGE